MPLTLLRIYEKYILELLTISVSVNTDFWLLMCHYISAMHFIYTIELISMVELKKHQFTCAIE